jgi:hypothetical protein
MNGTTIATTNVVAVLLADGWHRVVQGSFSVGALGFGADADLGTPGCCFEEADHGSPYRPAALAGPLSSVLAVRLADRSAGDRMRVQQRAPTSAAGGRVRSAGAGA